MALAAAELRRSPAQHVPSLIVSALGTAFGTVLLLFSGMLAEFLTAGAFGELQAVKTMLSVLSSVFLGIALFVAGVVTANTFGTIIAGRVAQIALIRVVGASASSLRRSVAIEGLAVGVVGAAIGFAAGAGAAFAAVPIADAAIGIDLPGPVLADPVLALPAIAGLLTTWLASWAGAGRVLSVTPMEAVGGSEQPGADAVRRRPVKLVLGLLALAGGIALLAAGVVIGQSESTGVLVAMLGGMVSFVGVVMLSERILPPVLAGVGALFGRGASARLGAANARTTPERSARAVVGMLIGVTLVTTFVVAMTTVQRLTMTLAADLPADVKAEMEQTMANLVSVFAVLIGFSIVLAVVGLVNTLALSVVQRRRELGLLRALGFTRRQVRGMILAESAQGTIAAVAVGLVLGVGYGWAGAQALMGAAVDTLVVPAVPPVFAACVVLGTALVSVVAALAPSRRATAVSPVAAIAAD